MINISQKILVFFQVSGESGSCLNPRLTTIQNKNPQNYTNPDTGIMRRQLMHKLQVAFKFKKINHLSDFFFFAKICYRQRQSDLKTKNAAQKKEEGSEQQV